ncbi:MAG: hypothetical protein ACTSRW_00065 [Candidatus Helarchaeota archaeon]
MSTSSKMQALLKEGNSYRILNLKRFKKEASSTSSIFSKTLTKVMKTMISMEKDHPTFQEIAQKHGLDFADIKDLLVYLYERDCISFMELLPFFEEKLTQEKGKSVQEKLMGLGLMDRANYEESLEILRNVLPYLENADNTLEYIAEKINVRPLKLQTILRRFKPEWIPIELE